MLWLLRVPAAGNLLSFDKPFPRLLLVVRAHTMRCWRSSHRIVVLGSKWLSKWRRCSRPRGVHAAYRARKH